MNNDDDDDGDNDNSISMSIYYGGWDGQVICTYSSAPLNDRTNRSGDIDHHASGIFYVDILLLKSPCSFVCPKQNLVRIINTDMHQASCMHPGS